MEVRREYSLRMKEEANNKGCFRISKLQDIV